MGLQVQADRERRLRSNMDKLRTKNRSLREQVDDLEEILGIGPEQPNSAWPSTNFALPCETDVDRAFDYLEGILSQLHERIEKLEKRPKNRDSDTPL